MLDPEDQRPAEHTPEQEPDAAKGPAAPLPEGRPPENPPWSGWDVLLIAVAELFCILVFSFGTFAIAIHLPAFRHVPAQDLARDPRVILPVQVAAYAVVVLFMYALVRHSYGRPFWPSVKWNWRRARPALAYVGGGVLLATAVQAASSVLPIPKSLPIEKMFNTQSGAYLMAAFGISIAPLMEELFFRGFLYPVLARRMGMWAGVLLTGAAFAALHESQLGHAWAPVMLLFVVGVVLTLARARTGSVAAGFLIHVGYNLMLFASLWYMSDHFRHLERAM
jgi:uncharacterized protein